MASFVAPFPEGANDTDTIISGVHFNLTALHLWNYTLYTNSTLSNSSHCWITLPNYVPTYVYPNGSFTNSSTCYQSFYSIGTRAGIGLAFVGLFSIFLLLTTVNLTRLGALHLPAQKRFVPVSRRWQWYWSLWTCAFALVSLITGIDVDRYYIASLPIILNVFFWYIMQMGAVASVWEAVRHWGSWMERQFVDPDPTRLRQDDRRSRIEFYLPLVFYLWWWLHFFMIIPRSWTRLELQRYPGQAESETAPMATDGRFKAGAFFLLVAWLTILTSLAHSIRHYILNDPDPHVRCRPLYKVVPIRHCLTLAVMLCLVVYQIICSFDLNVSPLKIKTNLLAMYLGGYAPSFLIIVLHNVFGAREENEDLQLIRQRRERNAAIDHEQGYVPKPKWWDLVKFGNVAGLSVEERLARQTEEIRPTRLNRNATTVPNPNRTMTVTECHSGNDGDVQDPPPPYFELSHTRSNVTLAPPMPMDPGQIGENPRMSAPARSNDSYTQAAQPRTMLDV